MKYFMTRYMKALYKLFQGDSLARFELMVKVAKLIYPSYRFSWPQMGWWDDIKFNNYLENFSEINGMNMDRRWMLKQIIRLTHDVPGDTAECGVYLGASSYLICQSNVENKKHTRNHYIFDSFEGLSAPVENDGSYWTKGDLSVPMNAAVEALSSFKNTVFMKGWIPSRFSEISDKAFSFIHIDVDLYQPTLDSIEFFYSRMNEGGVILCDDYGCTTCPGATRAIDEFLKDKKEAMISLSSGGGFMIKGCVTSQ